MFARYRGAIRRIDPDVLDTYFTVAEGPRRVGRDGVRYGSILYTPQAEDLVKLQGRDVWILPSLDNVGLIALCDEREKLLCYAAQQQLVKVGAKDEHARAAFARAARVRRLAKAYLPERDFRLETPTGQILREKAAFARSEEDALRKQRPAPPAPDVPLVRADLATDLKRPGRKRSPFRRLSE